MRRRPRPLKPCATPWAHDVMKRQKLLHELSKMRAWDLEEAAHIRKTMTFVLNTEDCFERHHLPGHVSASAWIINEDGGKILLMHHSKLGQWLQPGGHADGAADMLEVARREALEETGLPGHCLQCLSPKIFDVHVHQVAAVKGAPHHQHFDIRYLFRASSNTTPPGNHESFSLAWVPIHDVKLYQNSHGHRRLVAKTRQALFKP